MTAKPVAHELLPGCEPLPARECRCVRDMPCQDPDEAARCAKCGLWLAPDRAVAAGALPEREEVDASADPLPAEDAEGPPDSAIRGPGPACLDTQDGRPRRNGQAPEATARTFGPGSPELQIGDAA